MTFPIIFILILTLANALFASAELAIVSVRKIRLQKRAALGDHSARVALDLASDPTKFLSTVQIGISLVQIVAGAVGAATMSAPVEEILLSYAPWITKAYAGSLSFALVVTACFLVQLVLGELVPKRLALAFPEFFATRLGVPISLMARFAAPAVQALGYVTDTALDILGVKQEKDAPVSDEDVADLMDEGVASGAMHVVEKRMVEGVLSLDDLTVEEIMSPRSRIIWLNVDDSDEVNWRKIVASGHSYFPVYKASRDTVVGIVSIKSLWANLSLAQTADIKSLVVEPVFVPPSMTGSKFLETLKRSRTHIALVSDEFGGMLGLVTLNDVFEHIVGELPSGDQPRRRNEARKRSDGSWLVDAILGVDEFRQAVPIGELPGESDGAYETMGGFVIHHLGRIPSVGDSFEFGGFKFEVLDMERHRIDKILVIPIHKPEEKGK